MDLPNWLVAVMRTRSKSPAVVGVPEMRPVVRLMVRPGGRPVAVQVAGKVVFRI